MKFFLLALLAVSSYALVTGDSMQDELLQNVHKYIEEQKFTDTITKEQFIDMFLKTISIKSKNEQDEPELKNGPFREVAEELVKEFGEKVPLEKVDGLFDLKNMAIIFADLVQRTDL